MKFTDQSKNVIIDKLEDLYKRKKIRKLITKWQKNAKKRPQNR